MNKTPWLVGGMSVAILTLGFFVGLYADELRYGYTVSMMCMGSHGVIGTRGCVCPGGLKWSTDGYCYEPAGPEAKTTKRVKGRATVKTSGPFVFNGEYDAICTGGNVDFTSYEIDLGDSSIQISRFPNYCPPGAVCLTNYRYSTSFISRLNDRLEGIDEYLLQQDGVGRTVRAVGMLKGFVEGESQTMKVDIDVTCPGP